MLAGAPQIPVAVALKNQLLNEAWAFVMVSVLVADPLKFASSTEGTKPAPLFTYHCQVTDVPSASASIIAFCPKQTVVSAGISVISAAVFTVNVASGDVTLFPQPVTTT